LIPEDMVSGGAVADLEQCKDSLLLRLFADFFLVTGNFSLKKHTQKSISSVIFQGISAFFHGAVADLKQCMDDSALLLSVAITASSLGVLDSYQMSMAITSAYPHVICYEQLLPFLDLPPVEEPEGYLDTKPS